VDVVHRHGLRARALALSPRRTTAAAAHGVALVATLALVPAMLAIHAAQRAEVGARVDRALTDHAAAAERTIAERPARGHVAPTVASLPARATAPVDEASVRARLDAVGFSVSDGRSDNSAFAWQLHARPAEALTVDLSLRPAHSSDFDGQLIGAAWISVRSPDPAARARVLRFVAQRQDTTEATLGEALRSVGVPGITARGGSAWGYINRREYSVVAVALDEQGAMVARACTVADEGLLCAEISRTIHRRADPNWARYALVTAASAR